MFSGVQNPKTGLFPQRNFNNNLPVLAVTVTTVHVVSTPEHQPLYTAGHQLQSGSHWTGCLTFHVTGCLKVQQTGAKLLVKALQRKTVNRKYFQFFYRRSLT